jgi:hypothetical protein
LKLEYVASGVSFVRLNDQNIPKEMRKRFKNWFQKISSKHKFSMLYNAYQEADFPNILKDYGVPLYSDSGGLQMMRRGIEITDEKKKEIYKAQLPSDYAFCFDEVPIERIDDKRRYVFKDGFYEKGVITGKNVKDQVDFFRKNNAKTKVFLIAQGQEIEDYENYIRGLVSVLDKDDYDYIAGFAFSCACSGISNYTTLKAITASLRLQEILPEIPDKVKKRIHYLGFGSLKRFLLIKELSKHFHPDMEISADSTSITMTYHMGGYVGKNNKNYALRRYSEEYLNDAKDTVLEIIFKDMKNFIKKYDLDVDDKEFEEIRRTFIMGTYISRGKLPEKEKSYFERMLALYFLLQIDNVMEGVEEKDLLWMEQMDRIPYQSLLKAKNVAELDKIVNTIIKKPKDLHPRVCGASYSKMNKFKELF